MKIKSLTVTDDNGVDHAFTSKSLLAATTVEEAEPVVEEVPAVDAPIEPTEEVAAEPVIAE